FLTAISGKLRPVVINFFLRLTVHEERYCFGEFELWARVERDELLTIEFKVDNHDAAFRARPGFAIASDVSNLRVLENGSIEIHRFLGVLVEPEKRSDLLCFDLLFGTSGGSGGCLALVGFHDRLLLWLPFDCRARRRASAHWNRAILFCKKFVVGLKSV